jgi:hypothetical protein
MQESCQELTACSGNLLWEGHVSDPCWDQVHAHSHTSPMAIWQSTPGVRVVLVLGVRRDGLGAVVHACACTPYGLYILCIGLFLVPSARVISC